MTVSLLAALSACMNLQPASEHGTANLDITDNQYVDNSQIPVDDLVDLWLSGRVGTDGVAGSATLQIRPDLFAQVQLLGQDSISHVTAGADEVQYLSSSLARRYGDDSLPATLNRLRSQAIESGSAGAWAQNTYRRTGNPIGADARASVGGFGSEATATARLGFWGHDTEYTWVRPVASVDDTDASMSFPETLADVGAQMKPGECISMRGTGSVGFNFGVGSRVLFETPENEDDTQHTVGAIADGALRVALDTNRLDMQLCMLDNGHAVLEAGVGKATETSVEFALGGGYGAHGLREPSIRLGDQEVDARTVLDRALRARLFEQFGKVFAAGAEAGVLEDVREGLVRYDIDTNSRDQKVQAAVRGFLQGDLRLAQELARRDTAGISTQLEVTRQGEVAWASAGISVFGIELSAAGAGTESEFSMANPGGSVSGFATREERSSGFLWNKAGYSRTVLAGVETPRGGVSDSETGLYMSWRDIDRQMERNKLNMNTFGVLAQIVGAQAFEPIRTELNSAAGFVQGHCANILSNDNFSDSGARQRLEDCIIEVQTNDYVTMRVQRATDMLEAAMAAAHTETSEVAVARQAMALAIAAAKAYEFPAMFTGAPNTRIESQAWLSEDALARIMGRTGDEFAAAVKSIDPGADTGDLRDIAREFDEGRSMYNDLNTIAEATVAGGKKVGFDTLVVSLRKVGSRIDLEGMTVRTLAAWRGDALATMVDELLGEIGDIRFWNDRKARTFTYAMLALSGSELRDYRFDFQMKIGTDGANATLPRLNDNYRRAGYVDTRDDAIDMLDGIDDDAVGVSHRGANVHHFGEGVGWTVNQMARLANIAN